LNQRYTEPIGLTNVAPTDIEKLSFHEWYHSTGFNPPFPPLNSAAYTCPICTPDSTAFSLQATDLIGPSYDVVDPYASSHVDGYALADPNTVAAGVHTTPANELLPLNILSYDSARIVYDLSAGLVFDPFTDLVHDPFAVSMVSCQMCSLIRMPQ
jgi:hypothetical protein